LTAGLQILAGARVEVKDEGILNDAGAGTESGGGGERLVQKKMGD